MDLLIDITQVEVGSVKLKCVRKQHEPTPTESQNDDAFETTLLGLPVATLKLGANWILKLTRYHRLAAESEPSICKTGKRTELQSVLAGRNGPIWR